MPSGSSRRSTRYPAPIHPRRVHLPKDRYVPGIPLLEAIALQMNGTIRSARSLSH